MNRSIATLVACLVALALDSVAVADEPSMAGGQNDVRQPHDVARQERHAHRQRCRPLVLRWFGFTRHRPCGVRQSVLAEGQPFGIQTSDGNRDRI